MIVMAILKTNPVMCCELKQDPLLLTMCSLCKTFNNFCCDIAVKVLCSPAGMKKAGNAFSGVSNLFGLWGSECREEQRYQEVPSPPPSPPPPRLFSTPPPTPPPPPPPPSPPRRQMGELENRLEMIHEQIQR
ncbi:Potassium voltage-gated channel subfamily H member 2 [Merluccius polli]|uniref:Potassium voltage-gated channel subfamily H member 2 n=1 Tax=Merluccius polli TaxID=89951 RepID=A0AA47PA92_MERPO|nr:Potassium voltage-gated channel subfamily H member 2 [Merluccius polli]